MTRPNVALVALAVSAVIAAGCGSQVSQLPTKSGEAKPVGPSKAGLKPLDQRKAAPDFELKDADGKPVKLSEYKGKVVLLNFWATWCTPCKVEIPWFVEFERQYKDRGFATVGISMDDDGWEVVKPYIADNQINYRILMQDPKIADLYGGVESLPTSFLIDRDGKIAKVHVGLVSKSDYQDGILELLEGAPRAGAAGVDLPVVAAAGVAGRGANQ